MIPMDGLVTQFNQLPIEVFAFLPQCILLLFCSLFSVFVLWKSSVSLMTYTHLFVLTDFLYTISLLFFNYLKEWESLGLCRTVWTPWAATVHESPGQILEWVFGPFSRDAPKLQRPNPDLLDCRQIFYQLSHQEAPFNYLVSCLRFSIFSQSL